MKVAIKPRSQRFVEEQMKAGHFSSAEEVVQAGLKMLREQDANLQKVRSKIAIGLKQAKRGELMDGDEVFDEIFGKTRKNSK